MATSTMDCDECGLRFCDNLTRQFHVREKHSGGNTSQEEMEEETVLALQESCPVPFCGERFHQKALVFHHIKEGHIGMGLERELLQCPFCDFKTNTDMNTRWENETLSITVFYLILPFSDTIVTRSTFPTRGLHSRSGPGSPLLHGPSIRPGPSPSAALPSQPSL